MAGNKTIIIHSMVSTGYVGSNTISAVLQMGGSEVVIVPTVIYSNHLGHPTVGGGKIPEDILASIFKGIIELGTINETSTIITGFIGSAEQVKIIAEFVRRTKTVNPEIRYLCDPVMGDINKGRYVDPEVPHALIQHLVPMADLLTPNQFEIETIIDKPINAIGDAPRLLKGHFDFDKQQVIITGLECNVLQNNLLYTVMVDDKGCTMFDVPNIDLHPAGTGDMFTAYLSLLLHKGMKLRNAVEFAGVVVYKVLLTMSKENRTQFELQDILHAMKIIPTRE